MTLKKMAVGCVLALALGAGAMWLVVMLAGDDPSICFGGIGLVALVVLSFIWRITR